MREHALLHFRLPVQYVTADKKAAVSPAFSNEVRQAIVQIVGEHQGVQDPRRSTILRCRQPINHVTPATHRWERMMRLLFNLNVAMAVLMRAQFGAGLVKAESGVEDPRLLQIRFPNTIRFFHPEEVYV